MPVIPALGRWLQENQETKTIINYIDCGPAWGTWDLSSKNKYIKITENKKKNN